MRRASWALAPLVVVVWAAAVARADAPPPDTRKVVQDEIKAYMKAEKEKKDAEDKEKGAMKVYWKDAVVFESADKMFSAKLIGRLQIDYWTFPHTDEDFENALGDFWDTGLFFRRARMGFELQFKKNTRFKFEYDFARGGTNQAITDAYIAFVDLAECGWGVPDVYIGHFQECGGGLEELSSDNYSMFIEQNLATNTFAPFRNNGIMLQKGFACMQPCKEGSKPFPRVLAQAGFFGAFSNNWGDGVFSDEGADEFAGDQDGWAVDGRIVALPWVDCSCPECRLLHVGAYASYRDDLRPDNIRYSARPEVGIGPRSIDTGADIVANSAFHLGAEAALILNRFSVQGEYMMVNVDAPTQGDPTYWGAYLQASYFLTGECRAYDLGKGVFGRLKPCRPFFCGDCCPRGPGAWEIAARFSTVDLNDGDIAVRGGEEWNATAGLTWYVNNNVKVMFNYVHAEITDRPTGAANTLTDGSLDAFGVRVAASF